MNILSVLLMMIFCHIVDDYYLQGWLASAKQKDWWKKNAPEKLYEDDYIWALIMHSFSWSFMIMLPLMHLYSFNLSLLFVMVFLVNVFVHAVIDDQKANRKTINLWIDQLIHILQIALTVGVLFPY